MSLRRVQAVLRRFPIGATDSVRALAAEGACSTARRLVFGVLRFNLRLPLRSVPFFNFLSLLLSLLQHGRHRVPPMRSLLIWQVFLITILATF